MKRVLVILFSGLMILAQSVAPGSVPAPKAEARCTCCACGRKNCCVKQSTSAPLPLPVAPAPAYSAKQFLLALAAGAFILATPISPATHTFSSELPADRSDAVPLYQRNCAYLI